MKSELTKQLRRDEGVEYSAYQDHLGYWTIGVGRLIDSKKGGHLTDTEVDFLLANDIDKFTSQVGQFLPWTAKLDDARKGVLINMAFNLGTQGLLGFKNTLKMIEEGRYEEAATAMLQSKWANQVKGRATRLAEQMRTGKWQ